MLQGTAEMAQPRVDDAPEHSVSHHHHGYGHEIKREFGVGEMRKIGDDSDTKNLQCLWQGMDVIPLAPFVMGSASAHSRATSVKTKVTMAK